MYVCVCVCVDGVGCGFVDSVLKGFERGVGGLWAWCVLWGWEELTVVY